MKNVIFMNYCFSQKLTCMLVTERFVKSLQAHENYNIDIVKFLANFKKIILNTLVF